MVRKEGWELLLSAYIKERRTTPFQWGVNDCVTFSADCVLRLTDIDLIAEYRGYTSEAEANELMQGLTLLQMIKQVMGEALANYRLARRGDVVFTNLGALGIVDDTGQRVAVMTENGIGFLPLKESYQVWRY